MYMFRHSSIDSIHTEVMFMPDSPNLAASRLKANIMEDLRIHYERHIDNLSPKPILPASMLYSDYAKSFRDL
jgi:hypothetical protein